MDFLRTVASLSVLHGNDVAVLWEDLSLVVADIYSVDVLQDVAEMSIFEFQSHSYYVQGIILGHHCCYRYRLRLHRCFDPKTELTGCCEFVDFHY